MTRFISVNNRLLNAAHITDIAFLDSHKKIIFNTQEESRTYSKVYENEEDYEVACANLKSHLEAIYID